MALRAPVPGMETERVRIEIGGEDDEVELPGGVLDYLADGSQTPARTAGDLLMVDCTHRLHAEAHHTEGETDEDLLALEEAMRERFEARFGSSFSELTGHEH